MTHDEEKDVTSNYSSRYSTSRDSEEIPLNEDERISPLYRRPRRWLNLLANDSPFWKLYSIFMTAAVLILILTLIRARTDPQTNKSCPAADLERLSFDNSRTSSSHSHMRPHHEQNAEDPLDGYPLGAESYDKDNIVTTKFYKDLRYMTLDHGSDYLWEEHLHMVTGNIKLPPTEENGNSSLKAIAMFHQMHCLAAMRSVLQKAREGEEVGKDWSDDFHWPHCFDYLRMTILCFADSTLESMTLEPGPVNDGKVVKVIDGGSDTRYCRSSSPLYMLERKYGPNSQYGYPANHGSD